MKTFRPILSSAAVAVALFAFTASVHAARPGTVAPDFTVQDVDGKTVTLSDFKGKTVVLEWANYQCPFVKMHYESDNIPALQEKHTAQDIVWLTVHSSAPGEQGYHAPADLIKENQRVKNSATHVLPDPGGEIGHLYEAKTTPQIYVIDAEGIVQYNGAINSVPSSNANSLANATPYADNAILAVAAGQTPDPAATQPYGCSVKYAN